MFRKTIATRQDYESLDVFKKLSWLAKTKDKAGYLVDLKQVIYAEHIRRNELRFN